MADPPTITSQLFSAITDPAMRAKVGLIIDLCVAAVANLDSLDQEIYQVAQAAVGTQGAGRPSKQQLRGVAGTVLEGVRGLASYLTNSDLAADEDREKDDDGLDFDFDLGGAAAPTEVTLDDDDIASVLDGFAPQRQRTCDERWAVLRAELTSFAYGLSSQLEEFDQRFAEALAQDRIPQAQRELEDVGNALIDGVFALMSAICESCLDSFERDQILPGHRDALGKALLVRRGIADLRRAVKGLNEVIQDPQAADEERQAGVEKVASELSAFIDSEVWSVMRSADRLELRNFQKEIADRPFKQAALSCEGFDKYLDSLLSVNQRDVLITHDRELLHEIAAILEGVGPIVDISPHGAMDMVHQAFAKAECLYGFQIPLDELLCEWQETVSQSTDPQAVVEIGQRLAGFAAAASK